MSNKIPHNRTIDHARVWHLHRQGVSTAVIAERLGWSQRGICRSIQVTREAQASAANTEN